MGLFVVRGVLPLKTSLPWPGLELELETSHNHGDLEACASAPDHQHPESHSTPTRTRHTDDQSQGPVVTLPYVRGLSEAVRRVLTPLGVRVSFRPNSTLRQLLVKLKDRVPTEELAGVVYQIPRAGCPATYVGQTGRCLSKRMKEHQKVVESGDCANLALAEHAWSHHHPVDWNNVRVLEQQPHLYHRLTLESIHIRSHPNTLNRNDGTLPLVYNSLFSC